MKTTGITRRIDELGRIVIPKEIRKNMHLKTGELLEIYLNDSETIMLKKHSMINKHEEFIRSYIKVLATKINADIYITSLSDIAISNVEDMVGEKLSDDLENIMTNNTNFTNIKNIKLTNKLNIESPVYVYSLRPNGDLYGIIIYKLKNDNYKEVEKIIKFSTAFLEEYFENN